MSDQFKKVFLDLLPNQPKDDQTRESNRRMLRAQFEGQLADNVERMWELPPIILNQASGRYRDLLLEARDLFIAGYFYSCVAMCGIIGERLVKDMFRASVFLQKNGQITRPMDAAFDDLDYLGARNLVEFLGKCAILEDDAQKAALKLQTLRNRYAHAKGKKPEADAINAIKLLHVIVEGTISVFKECEIKNGAFEFKSKTPSKD
jgi:hypothetical protein